MEIDIRSGTIEPPWRQALEDLGKLLLRIVVAGLMLFHGVDKVLTGLAGIRQVLGSKGLGSLRGRDRRTNPDPDRGMDPTGRAAVRRHDLLRIGPGPWRVLHTPGADRRVGGGTVCVLHL